MHLSEGLRLTEIGVATGNNSAGVDVADENTHCRGDVAAVVLRIQHVIQPGRVSALTGQEACLPIASLSSLGDQAARRCRRFHRRWLRRCRTDDRSSRWRGDAIVEETVLSHL